MKILDDLRREGRADDMQSLVDHIPYAWFLDIRVDRKGTEITTILPFAEKLIGNTTCAARRRYWCIPGADRGHPTTLQHTM